MIIVKKEDTHTNCQYKRKSVYAKDSIRIPHIIRCSIQAYYLIDNIPMCKTHAGNYLLNKYLPTKDQEGVFVDEVTNMQGLDSHVS
jgi:hypothetical protein